MDMGNITATDVAKAFFCSTPIQPTNNGTNIKPPPAPNKPFNIPASAPTAMDFHRFAFRQRQKI